MEKGNFALISAAAVICTCFYIKLLGSGFGLGHHTVPNIDPAKTHFSYRMLESEQTITPVKDTNYLMVSAYKDHRLDGATRIIGILKRDYLQPLYCIFCCQNRRLSASPTHIEMHSKYFGSPFVTTDVLCRSKPMCNATHVTISTHSHTADVQNQRFLPIQNEERREDTFPYNFTVCISNLFRGYNNVLQFVQTMEVYKIIGVQRVVIYNTSCGPDLERVLINYRDKGILEIVQWPIDQFLNPSKGWDFVEDKEDMHYYGQLATLNECMYRYMYQSKYLLLNNIDEIIMPYKHANLQLLLDNLQHQHPNVGVFEIENHIFPITQFEDSGKFKLPQWRDIPGINILEHIYREPSWKSVNYPSKLIINPRYVEQSVHSVLKTSGEPLSVSPDVCRIVHVRVPLQWNLTKDQLLVDKKLWEFEKVLVQNVDNALQNSGLLMP